MKNETKDKIKIDCFDEMRQIAYSRESDEVKEKRFLKPSKRLIEY